MLLKTIEKGAGCNDREGQGTNYRKVKGNTIDWSRSIVTHDNMHRVKKKIT